VEIINVLAGVIFCIGFIPYALAILGRDIRFQKVNPTKPSKASWIIWVGIDTITIAGMFAKDAVNGQILGAVIGGWMIIVLTIKYGARGWTKLDRYCLGGAFFGIMLWQISGEANFGIVVSNLVMFLGSIPTFKSAWRDPCHENKIAWTIFWISCVLAVIAIPQLTLADTVQPITFLIVQSIMMCILFIRPLRRAHS
jgi:hypothetical protein